MLSARDIREFNGFLRNASDRQIQGIYEKEHRAGRDEYVELTRAEASRRGISLDEDEDNRSHSTMKRAHSTKKRMTHAQAKTLLESAGINFKRDYHEGVSMSDANLIAEVARSAGYRKRKDAPGSTARMYFQFLSRLK
jgi:hypothetical protein